MCKRLIYFSCFILVLSLVNTSFADLVAYYSMDEGAGADVADGSGNGHDGVIDGTPTWIAGNSGTAIQFGVNGSNGIYCPAFDTTAGTQKFTAAMWIKFTVNTAGDQYQGILANRNGNTDQYWGLEINRGDGSYYFGAEAAGGATQYGLGTLPQDKWTHLAITFDGTTVISYLDGVQNNTSTTPRYGTNPNSLLRIGSSDAGANTFEGVIDEVYIYSGEILTAAEIASVMAGDMKPASTSVGLAKLPIPASGSEEVSIDVGGISWKPGDFIFADGGTHNVFFGTDKASLTNATIAEPLGTSVYEGLDVNNVALDRLEYGTTYYWRVDEVNIPSKPGTATGKIWSFTTELEGYPLEPAKIVNVTASENPVYPEEQEPNMTCNESGLDANDLHSTLLATMWLGMADEPGQVWIQYEFDRVYKLHDMLVWNYNELPPSEAYGAKDVNIAYSLDGETWTALGDTVTFNQAPGDETCTANTAVDFDGAVAKYVKLVFLNSFEDGLYTGGVSEVRFSAMPTRAAEPDPEDEDTDIAVDAVLGWKAGRDAVEHNLYIDTDVNAVKEGTASMTVLQDASYSPVLDLAKTYYWKVDEVNMADEYTTWDGDVWSFSTVQAIVVDNFEVGYDDTDANAVWATWIDGYGNESVNGALTGYEFPGPYLSTTNVNGGHSAPIRYNNTTAGYSEVKAQSEELPIGTVDWSLGSPKTLTIWFRGDPCNVVGDEELYCKIDGQQFVYAGDIAYLGRAKWMQWDIDLAGMNLSDVDDIAIGIKKTGATGGSGVLLIDYIRLTGLDPTTVGESIWFEAETMTLTGSMRVSTTTTGFSGTGYVDAPTTIPTPTEPNLASLATKTFTVTGGKYIVNARARDGFQFSGFKWLDSFWVRIINNSGTPAATDVTLQNANGWVNWDNSAWTTYNNWVWVQVWNQPTTGANQNVTWTLPAGAYTIQFTYKDTGNMLDIVEIVKVSD